MGILASATVIGFVLTRDRDRAKAFYSDVLGLAVKSEDAFATVYDCNGMVLRLTTVEDHVAHPHTVIGWAVNDIRAATAALRAKGVVFNIYPGFGQDDDGIWTQPGGGVMVNWFNDPDGNALSLTQSG